MSSNYAGEGDQELFYRRFFSREISKLSELVSSLRAAMGFIQVGSFIFQEVALSEGKALYFQFLNEVTAFLHFLQSYPEDLEDYTTERE